MRKKWPFDEKKYLNEILKYIDKCNNNGHYANENKDIHTFQLIVQGKDNRGLHYATMTVLKYLDRFGSKEGYNRKDLLKAIHFLIYSLYAYDNHSFKDEKMNNNENK